MSQGELPSRRTWRQVAAIVDGKQVAVGPGAILAVDGDEYTVTFNGKLIQRGTGQPYPDTSPLQSDVIVREGLHAGKTLQQILKIEGDVLIGCIAPPGEPRPTEFASRPGSRHTLSVWLRTDEAEAAKLSRGPLSWQSLAFIALIVIGSGTLNRTKPVLLPQLGYVGMLVATTLIAALIVTALGLFFKWDWRAALTTGLAVGVGLNTFDELTRAIEPVLGEFGAIVVSGSTALVVVLALSAVLGRVLRVRG